MQCKMIRIASNKDSISKSGCTYEALSRRAAVAFHFMTHVKHLEDMSCELRQSEDETAASRNGFAYETAHTYEKLT